MYTYIYLFNILKKKIYKIVEKINRQFNTRKNTFPGVLVNDCNSNTWEAEARGLQVQGQPGLQSKSLYQRNKIIKRKEEKN
jgi:hypothetical protein